MDLLRYLRFATNELLQFNVLPTEVAIYDTAWAAQLDHREGGRHYPLLLGWLAEQQDENGSWGASVPHVHDRVLNTLTMVLLLARLGQREQDVKRMQHGIRFLWSAVDRLRTDFHETIGFELLIPTLLSQAWDINLDLPYNQLSVYGKIREKKLSLLPKDIFRIRNTALFSLEAFEGYVDVSRAEHLLLSHGSISISPAATCAFASQTDEWRTRLPQTASYLDSLLLEYGHGLPHIAPYDVFMRTWTISNLSYGQLLDPQDAVLQEHYRYLHQSLRSDGVGPATDDTADSDDTAMALLLLHQAGYEVDGTILLQYERDDHMACFPFERTASVSANLHILEALEVLPPDDQERVREKIVGYLLREQLHQSFWVDKWHVSPYYPTSLALLILSRHLGAMNETINWMFYTQHKDGAWGYYGATAEETALCLLGLLHYHRTVTPIPAEPLHRAASWLLNHEQPFKKSYPELWIGKVLYAPIPVIRSAILAALNLYIVTFGTEFL